MQNHKRWRIHLGAEHWARHTYPRANGDELRLLGAIARGQQIGALGVTRDGRYVLVNGDHMTPLSTSQVRHALAAENAAVTHARRPPRPAPTLDSKPVTITVRRRRTYSKTDAALPGQRDGHLARGRPSP